MALSDLSILLAIVALGCYVQAVSGFAFGLIFMGGVSMLGVLSILDASIIVSLLAIANTGTALFRKERHIAKPQVTISLICALPMIALGLWLLTHFSSENERLLRHLLGIVIIVSALVLVVPPKPGKALSSLPVFGAFGCLAGLVGGLFSTSGPPVVFQFYRQNLAIPVIRDSLLTIFFISASLRTAMVILGPGMPLSVLGLAAGAFPVVIAATWLGKHYPPPIGATGMRRLAAALLVGSGISLWLR